MDSTTPHPFFDASDQGEPSRSREGGRPLRENRCAGSGRALGSRAPHDPTMFQARSFWTRADPGMRAGSAFRQLPLPHPGGAVGLGNTAAAGDSSPGSGGSGEGGIGEKEEVPKGSNSKSHAWTHSTSPPFFVARQSSQILAVLGGGLSPPREGLRKIRWHRGPAAPAILAGFRCALFDVRGGSFGAKEPGSTKGRGIGAQRPTPSAGFSSPSAGFASRRWI